MIHVGANFYEVTCDVPGCTHAEFHRTLDLARKGHAFGGKHTLFRDFVVRFHGWFHEKLHSKRTGYFLERDICPTHAPAYRALANATAHTTNEERTAHVED